MHFVYACLRFRYFSRSYWSLCNTLAELICYTNSSMTKKRYSLLDDKVSEYITVVNSFLC